MANTVDLNNITEYSEVPEDLQRKCAEVADLIQAAKHPIVFTGAGISTSANIPDFRGPNGVWTCQAKGVKGPRGVALVQAIPTDCHNFLQRLVSQDVVKYIVSQNIDGLHRRSGVPRENISELHGNTFLEVCWNCGADYEHPQEVHGGLNQPKTCGECHPRVPHFCHCSGKKCAKCGAMLKDSIIHFGENLPEQALHRAYDHAKKADLCIVLGSSLTVSPANEIPLKVSKRGGKLVIVNLQKTDMDKRANVRIFSKTDEVCNLIQRHLDAAAAPPTVASRSLAPQPTVAHQQHHVVVGNRHELVAAADGDNTHKWTMFCRTDSTSNPISKVVYGLHPTFNPATVTVTAAESPSFELARLGWGTFDVHAEIYFADGNVHRVTHALSFSSIGAEQSIPLQF